MGKKKSENQLRIVVCALHAAQGKEIQLLPFGTVNSKKGAFTVDENSIKGMIAAFNAEANDFVVDYEHQTLGDGIAPAAGWIKELIDKGKDGLWARVEWTPKAAEFIANKEYRYLSPVVILKNRKAVGFHSAALTNTPAIDGMTALANKLETENEEDNVMEEFLKKLAKALGLADTATEEEIMAAIEKACQNPAETVANKEVLELLGLKDDAKLDAVKGAVISLKNPNGYVKTEEFLALKIKLETKERDDLVKLALSSGKVAPAQKEWAEGYALKDPAGFASFLQAAPVVVPLKEVAGGAENFGGAKIADDVQLSINKALGISGEDFKKFGGEA